MYVVLLSLGLMISQGVTLSIDEIASKFHQTDYQIKYEWAEVVRYNKELVKYFHQKVFKYNRTTTAGNITFELNVDLGDNDMQVIVQAYKFASNEYRLFPLRFQMAYCLVLSKNVGGAQSSLKCGNFPLCVFKKGIRYHMCNWVPDGSHLPPFIPDGKYMFEFQFLFKVTEIGALRLYLNVFRPIPWE